MQISKLYGSSNSANLFNVSKGCGLLKMTKHDMIKNWLFLDMYFVLSCSGFNLFPFGSKDATTSHLGNVRVLVHDSLPSLAKIRVEELKTMSFLTN